MYTVGSLFTGIGGIDLAFDWAGFDVAWQVEIDDYCNELLKQHWPAVPKLRDVRAVTGRTGKGWRRYHQLPRVDVLAGGFPCQDISVTGKGAGLDGDRSGLWFEFERLIGELRPRVVFLENVPAIAFRGATAVTAALAEMGYVGAWGVISAADAGASHRRERWWCIAWLDDTESLGCHDGANSPNVRQTKRNEYPPAMPGELRGRSRDVAHANGRRPQARNARQWRVLQPDSRGQRVGDTERLGCNGNTRRTADSQPEDGYAPGTRASKSRVGRADARLSFGMDGIGGLDAITTQERPGEILCPLWQEADSEALQRQARGLWSVLEAQILRSDLHGQSQNEVKPNQERPVETSNQAQKAAMRTMRNNGNAECSSYRWRSGQQQPSESNDAVCRLSYEVALGTRQKQLPSRLDVARPGQPQHEWEAPRTVPPGSVPHRASRLKALGNAVVPQVVYPLAVEIMQLLVELDR